MNHDWLMTLAIFADVLQTKPCRKIKVELHRRKLPQSADRIDQLDIDLWSVERRFARDRLVRNAASIEHFLERVLCGVPLLIAAGKALAIVRLPRRKLDLELVETKRIQ